MPTGRCQLLCAFCPDFLIMRPYHMDVGRLALANLEMCHGQANLDLANSVSRYHMDVHDRRTHAASNCMPPLTAAGSLLATTAGSIALPAVLASWSWATPASMCPTQLHTAARAACALRLADSTPHASTPQARMCRARAKHAAHK
jgi:hypothetical protein